MLQSACRRQEIADSKFPDNIVSFLNHGDSLDLIFLLWLCRVLCGLWFAKFYRGHRQISQQFLKEIQIASLPVAMLASGTEKL